mgnify:CR=1 FL=1
MKSPLKTYLSDLSDKIKTRMFNPSMWDENNPIIHRMSFYDEKGEQIEYLVEVKRAIAKRILPNGGDRQDIQIGETLLHYSERAANQTRI